MDGQERPLLGEIFVSRGVITAEQRNFALLRQTRSDRQRVGRILLQMGYITGIHLVEALAQQHGIMLARPTDYPFDLQALQKIPEKTAREYRILPMLKIDGTLIVAAKTDRNLPSRLSDIQKKLGAEIEAVPVAQDVDFERLLGDAYATTRFRGKRAQMLGEYLVQEGLIDEGQLKEALDNQKATAQPLGSILTALGYVDSRTLKESLSNLMRIPLIDLGAMRARVDPDVCRVLPPEFLEHNLVLPLSRDNGKLSVVVCRSPDPWLADQLQSAYGVSDISFYVAERNEVITLLREIFDLVERRSSIRLDVEVETPADGIAFDMKAGEDVVKILNFMLWRSVKDGASDIHIEQSDADVVIRERVDGRLIQLSDIPVAKDNIAKLISKIKVDCKMDIAERRRPQDGSFRRRFSRAGEVDFRVAVVPTVRGENVVIRVLDRTQPLISLNEIGFAPKVLERYLRIVSNPNGLILFTGPTGSGKTTSLYSTLDLLRRSSVKIVTAEDPVEYYFQGIQQSQVHEEIGNSFATYLRSFLRENPDIILVGEIRDPETMEFAVRAALTGHLVLSTLHTSDTIGVVPRMLSMGLSPDLLGSTLLAVVSQRLVRTACRTCGADIVASDELMAQFYPTGRVPDKARFRKGMGCVNCDDTGYRGRLAIFEFWEIDEDTKALICKGADEAALRAHALARGMVTLVQDALSKAEQGLTTLEEIDRWVPYRQIALHRTACLEAEQPPQG